VLWDIQACTGNSIFRCILQNCLFKIHVKLCVADHSLLVGTMFVYSSLVALCYVDTLCYGTFRLAQVQTTVVALPVFNRHQEFTELTVVFFLSFLTRPVLEAGLYLSVLTTPPPAIMRPAFNGIQATIRGFTVICITFDMGLKREIMSTLRLIYPLKNPHLDFFLQFCFPQVYRKVY